MSAKSYCTVN